MATTQSIRAEVNATAQAYTFIVNMVMTLLLRIAHKRGLSPDFIQRNFKVIETGITTWLSEHKLISVILQVQQRGSGSAVENWKTVFEYRAQPGAEVKEPPIQQVEEFCMRLAALPPGVSYQIYAEVAPDASHVPGWTPGTPLPLLGRSRKDFVRWGYGDIGAGLEYEGSDQPEPGSGNGDGPNRR